METENTTLKAIADAVANVKAAEAAVKQADKALRDVRIAAVDAADLSDFAGCWALYSALNDREANERLLRRLGNHLFPLNLEDKIYAIKENHKPLSAYVAGGVSYYISKDGMTCWVKFHPATKSWERNETIKYGLTNFKTTELPVERKKSDFEWDAKDRAWVLRAGLEVNNG